MPELVFQMLGRRTKLGKVRLQTLVRLSSTAGSSGATTRMDGASAVRRMRRKTGLRRRGTRRP
jgi:hypothetical protein